jgi:hypothetical protein
MAKIPNQHLRERKYLTFVIGEPTADAPANPLVVDPPKGTVRWRAPPPWEG